MVEIKTLDIPTRSFSINDDSTFSKIRTGLIDEKPSPPSKEQRRKDNY